MSIPNTPYDDYLILEANKLNKEVESLLAEIRSREKYSLTIIAAISAWAFINLDKLDIDLLKLISLIPLATTLIYGISVLMLYRNVKWIANYLKRIEEHFLPGHPGNFGWEKYFNTANRKSFFVVITIVLWLFQLGLAIILMCKVHDTDFMNSIKSKTPATTTCCKMCK